MEVANYFTKATCVEKRLRYETTDSKQDQRKLLKHNVAHILEMARRKGVKLSLGEIFRSKELAWFGHDKPASMGRRNMTDQQWENTSVVRLGNLGNLPPEQRESAKTAINTLFTEYNSKVKKKSQKSSWLVEDKNSEQAFLDKKPVWNKRNLAILKAVHECGATFFERPGLKRP